MAQRQPDDERLSTIAEFEQLPEEDAYTFELVRGRLVRSPRPASLHGRLMIRMGRLLDEFAEAGGHGVVLGDAGVVLSRDPDTVRGPDIAFFSKQRIPLAETKEKVADYLEAGVRIVWVVDPPSRTVTVYHSGGAGRMVRHDAVLEGDDVLPGFRLSLAAFFAH